MLPDNVQDTERKVRLDGQSRFFKDTDIIEWRNSRYLAVRNAEEVGEFHLLKVSGGKDNWYPRVGDQ